MEVSERVIDCYHRDVIRVLVQKSTFHRDVCSSQTYLTFTLYSCYLSNVQSNLWTPVQLCVLKVLPGTNWGRCLCSLYFLSDQSRNLFWCCLFVCRTSLSLWIKGTYWGCSKQVDLCHSKLYGKELMHRSLLDNAHCLVCLWLYFISSFFK